MQKAMIDCEFDTLLKGPVSLYDSRGRLIDSWTTWSEESEEITPDSMAELVRDFVCEEYDAAQEW